MPLAGWTRPGRRRFLRHRLPPKAYLTDGDAAPTKCARSAARDASGTLQSARVGGGAARPGFIAPYYEHC